jgi:hypothetical protein
MSPDMKASVSAASSRASMPGSDSAPTAPAVISDTTATGPTDSAWLLPKAA